MLFHLSKVKYFIIFYIAYILDTVKGLSYDAYPGQFESSCCIGFEQHAVRILPLMAKRGDQYDGLVHNIMFDWVRAAVFRGGMVGERIVQSGTQSGGDTSCHRFNRGGLRHIGA